MIKKEVSLECQLLSCVQTQPRHFRVFPTTSTASDYFASFILGPGERVALLADILAVIKKGRNGGEEEGAEERAEEREEEEERGEQEGEGKQDKGKE